MMRQRYLESIGLWRRVCLQRSVRGRIADLNTTGYCTWQAYMLCKFTGFKPGAQQRIEREMDVLAARIRRLKTILLWSTE